MMFKKQYFVILSLFLIGFSYVLIPEAEAKDFIINSECINGVWQATIIGNTGPLYNVKIITLDTPHSFGVEETFHTDENGLIIIPNESNRGYAKITKGGYNDQTFPTTCEFEEETIPDSSTQERESNYHDLIAIKSVKKISGDDSDLAVVEVRIFNSEMSTINVNPENIHLKNSVNEFFPLDLENKTGLYSDCLTSETPVRKGSSIELFLCFEVPKDPKEDYILVIDKNKTILDSPLEYILYLSSHNITFDHDVFDVGSVYFTVHDVQEKQLDKKMLVVKFTAFNGYAPVNKYGDIVPSSLPFTGKSIFLTSSEGEYFKSLSTQFANTGYEEYCPRISDVRTNQYANISLCFDISQSKDKDVDYWLVFNESPLAFSCPANKCQEKKWELSPFMETVKTQSPIVSSPMETTEKANQMTSPEAEKIPSWVKNTFSWYVDGLISEDEVISAIQFMIKEGIIKI